MQIVHDVRSFLNFCFYYRRFIEKFAIIYDFLYELIKNAEKKFKFVSLNLMIKNVFKCIKKKMYFNRVLIQFDIFLFFIIEIDVFDFDEEVVFYQINSDEKKKL